MFIRSFLLFSTHTCKQAWITSSGTRFRVSPQPCSVPPKFPGRDVRTPESRTIGSQGCSAIEEIMQWLYYALGLYGGAEWSYMREEEHMSKNSSPYSAPVRVGCSQREGPDTQYLRLVVPRTHQRYDAWYHKPQIPGTSILYPEQPPHDEGSHHFKLALLRKCVSPLGFFTWQHAVVAKARVGYSQNEGSIKSGPLIFGNSHVKRERSSIVMDAS